MPCDDELNHVLTRRLEINDAIDNGDTVKLRYQVINVYTEFKEFSRKQIKQYEATFKRFNTGNDGFLTFEELKKMMEKLQAPQTHLSLKQMIKDVDQDGDGRLSFSEFLLVFRKARNDELDSDSGLAQLAKLTEIDVDKVGVTGAKEFYEAKINEMSKGSQFEEDIKQEQMERRRQEEERQIRKRQFLEKAAVFK